MDKEHYSSLLRAYADPIEDPGLIPAPTLLAIAKHIDDQGEQIEEQSDFIFKAGQYADNLKKRIEELEEALQRIDNWAKAYPLKVFPEPDFKKVAEVLKASGLSLDAVSASNMRHVITQVKDIVEQALKGE